MKKFLTTITLCIIFLISSTSCREIKKTSGEQLTQSNVDIELNGADLSSDRKIKNVSSDEETSDFSNKANSTGDPDKADPTNGSVTDIVDISHSINSTMFLTKNGDVYIAGIMSLTGDKTFSKPAKIKENIKAISNDDWGDVFQALGVVDKDNNYYIKGYGPNGKKFKEFTKIMTNVSKASNGLILTKDNKLYIWGTHKNDLNTPSPKLLLNNVKDFSGNYLYGFAQKSNGDLYFWGNVNSGYTPTKIAGNVLKLGEYGYISKDNKEYEINFDNNISNGKAPKLKKVADNVKQNFNESFISVDNILYCWDTEVVGYDLKRVPKKVDVNVVQSDGVHVYLTTNGDVHIVDDFKCPSKNSVILRNICKIYCSGDDSNFAISNDGYVYMWGDNGNGKGGVGEKKKATIDKPTIVNFK